MNNTLRLLKLIVFLLLTLLVVGSGRAQHQPNSPRAVAKPPDGEAAEEHNTIFLPGDVPIELVRIPAGTFMVGRYPCEQYSFDWEDPQHEVTISSDYWMGKYTVTKGQWKALMDTAPWTGRGYAQDHPESPAVYISWHDAQEFITSLNAHIVATGQGSGKVRLPSEAEWEYAARAGTTTRFYWGDDPAHTKVPDYAWYISNVEGMYAHVVGRKKPNAWGLYDMSGNVYEWCEDDWHSDYEDAPGDGSARINSPRASSRVLRGGSWHSYVPYARSAYRSNYLPSRRSPYLGFRLAK